MNAHQYLQLMGIEVWQRRPAKPKASADEQAVVADDPVSSMEQVKRSLAMPERAPEKQPVAIPDVVETPEPSPPPAAGPSFLLMLLHFPGLSVASLYSSGLAGLPDNHQHFLTSLYSALSGTKTAGKVQAFRWPIVKSAHITQTWEEARLVFQQNGQELASRVLLFGPEASGLFDIEAAADGEANFSSTKTSSLEVWQMPELEHFFKQPLDKRRLWQALVGLQNELKGDAQ